MRYLKLKRIWHILPVQGCYISVPQALNHVYTKSVNNQRVNAIKRCIKRVLSSAREDMGLGIFSLKLRFRKLFTDAQNWPTTGGNNERFLWDRLYLFYSRKHWIMGPVKIEEIKLFFISLVHYFWFIFGFRVAGWGRKFCIWDIFLAIFFHSAQLGLGWTPVR